ncbi:GNL3L/Grn1 putative GTPase [Ceratobasidium sp. AG-Ba]|nr:GNL3L/Grn1 putative GTPase [Ceratobasidium sp. AG-Ba]QRW01612.1 GNL3L/Grn1 putative GTPase [Ceratobasidium sp. AG-Ba]
MPRIRKKTSKRGTTHQRTKVRQKVAETHKKRKRDAKRNPQWKSKHKKDPGIPSSLPFKEDILAEIEQNRRQAEEDKQRRKETKSQPAPVLSDAAPSTTTPTIVRDDPDTAPVLIDSSLPTLGAVIDSADAVLCVIDARDPQTFRSRRLEEVVAQKSKGLVLVLTKTDLVPREILAGWMTYLRSEVSAPVVAFRASDGFVPSADKGKQKASLESVSRDALLDAVAQVTPSHAAKDTRVAVVGQTNSGKSTLLNSLLAAPSLPIYQPSLQQPKKATHANTTLGAQSVSVSHAGRTYEFIDTPGWNYIQFNSQSKGKQSPEEVETSKGRDLLTRNRGSFVHWKETDAAAAYVVSRAKHEDLILHYNLPAYTPGDVSAFLGGVARASGRLRKGGVPDLSDTARSIARDWSLGRLPYFAVPPTATTTTIASDPALDACMSLKEMRAPPRAWPVQLESGVPDERDVALDAVFVVEVEERPRNARMEVDEDEGESEDTDEDEEMESVESGSEDEDTSEEDEEEEEEESDDEPAPAPKPASVLKSKRPTPATKTPKRVSFATKTAKPAPAPRRVGNAKSIGKRAQVVNAGEESYDFSKFF